MDNTIKFNDVAGTCAAAIDPFPLGTFTIAGATLTFTPTTNPTICANASNCCDGTYGI